MRGRAGKPDEGIPTTFLIDGATLNLNYVQAPYPAEGMWPPAKLLDPGDVQTIGSNHFCYVMLSAEGEDGLEWALAYTALVTLAAAAICAEAPAIGVFWPSSWALRTPKEMIAAADDVMAGRRPRAVWISLAAVRTQMVGGVETRGLMSFGLRGFVGREIEIAPAPLTIPEGRALAETAITRFLDARPPRDGEVLTAPGGTSATVRLAERFMRPAPVCALVTADALIDAETLEPKGRKAGAERGGGLVSRFFGGRR